jgi:peroxiredoxin
MRSRQNSSFYLLLSLCLCLAAIRLFASQPLANASPDLASTLLQPGTQAPDCSLKGIDGINHDFPATGKWNMIFFWSLFCHSCTEEMPLIQKQLDTLQSENLSAFFVSLDSEKMHKALVNFCSKRDLKQPVLMEQLASDSYVTADKWGVRMTPSVFIVAPDKKIAYSHQGPMDIEKFIADFRMLAAKK